MTPPDSARAYLKLRADLERERAELQVVVGDVGLSLELLAGREVSFLEVRGAADLLHDFYTGAEKLLRRIAMTLDGGVPAGEAWHRDLLESMTHDLPRLRPPVLRADTRDALEDYLRFRHLFRSMYGHRLQWERVRELLEGVAAVHRLLEEDLDDAGAFLEALAEDAAES